MTELRVSPSILVCHLQLLTWNVRLGCNQTLAKNVKLILSDCTKCGRNEVLTTALPNGRSDEILWLLFIHSCPQSVCVWNTWSAFSWWTLHLPGLSEFLLCQMPGNETWTRRTQWGQVSNINWWNITQYTFQRLPWNNRCKRLKWHFSILFLVRVGLTGEQQDVGQGKANSLPQGWHFCTGMTHFRVVEFIFRILLAKSERLIWPKRSQRLEGRLA